MNMMMVFLEDFNDSEYEQEENIPMDDNENTTGFKLSEGFGIDIGR